MTQQSHGREQFADEPLELDPPAGAGEETTLSASRLAPVAESIRYRRRAQQAERRLAELQQQLAEREAEHRQIEGELLAARRRGELTRLLAGRGVVDIEAAVLLSEQRLSGRPDADAGEVVEQLLKDKPYLSGGAGSAGRAALPSPTQGVRRAGGPMQLLRDAARRAGSGRLSDLDHYLKVRRQFK